jgi:hypothetical protein
VLPAPGGEIRRVCVNVNDPLPAVVSFGRHALTHDANRQHTLRFLAVDNWNHDERELHEIPEAREWFRQLWDHGKPLLRLLTESAWDSPPDDTMGLSQLEVSALGLGWFDVYLIAHGVIDGHRVNTADGPAIKAAATAPQDRETVRAELLEMSPGNPDGFTFDDAANRRVFLEHNMELAAHISRDMGEQRDNVVLVLSLLDSVGRKLAEVVADPAAIERTMADCRQKELHPAVLLAMPRTLAIETVDPFAPGAAGNMKRRPESGWHWGVFVAFNGTTLAQLNTPAMRGTP